MYRGRLERDLSVWVGKGLIPEATAELLLGEYDSRPASFSLGRVLMVLAAVLLGAALLLLVASNWEAIPRLVRAGAILAVIWMAYLGAAALFARGAIAAANALLVVGVLSFGGAISLIGQMYHLSGDEQTVMYLWFAIAAISAGLFRSGPATAIAGFLSWASFGVYLSNYDTRWVGAGAWAPLAMSVVLIALVRYTDAGRSRHLAYFLVVGWLAWLYTLHDDFWLAAAYVVCGLAVFLAVSLPPLRNSAFIKAAGAAPAFYAFLIATVGLLLLNIELQKGGALVVLSLVTLAIAVLAIALQGRDNGAVRYLAYLMFAADVLYLASETVGSILGTSSLFLLSGVFVALVAWLVIRLERRFGGKKAEVAQ